MARRSGKPSYGFIINHNRLPDLFGLEMVVAVVEVTSHIFRKYSEVFRFTKIFDTFLS